MRLWSIHPKYLDRMGLLAVWREGLLAKKVIEGQTKGYKNHPQLIRFRNEKNPLTAINAFLTAIYQEAKIRNYNFALEKIRIIESKNQIPVTTKQIEYEFKHLLKKLKIRDKKKYRQISLIKKIDVNPVFRVVPGKIAEWEKTKPTD